VHHEELSGCQPDILWPPRIFRERRRAIGYSDGVNEASTPQPDTTPVSPEVIAMARQAVLDFRECFWFRHPEADIQDRDDVELVIAHLRRNGGHRAWSRAQTLRKSCP
jgi:hypothetical protein